MPRTGRSRVRAIHSSEPAARDEGPRLIPLKSEPAEMPMNHYLQLADTALGTAARPARIKKKPEGVIQPEDSSAKE